MSDLPRPIEQGTPKIEKPTAPKPAEPSKETQPLGVAEQQIVNRIDKDGDEDNVLKDIVGVQPQVGGEAPKTPFQQFLDEQAQAAQTTTTEVRTSASTTNRPVESTPTVETNSSIVVNSSGETVMDEATAAKILGSDRPATNAEKIAAATQYPNLAARWGWSPADIEELRQELAVLQPSEADASKSPDAERTVTREQLQQDTFGRLYGDLLTAFAETPGITKEELMKQIGEYAREHRLAGPNLGRAVGMADRFCRIRDVVRATRERFPDDRALFEHTFGFVPQGKVSVIMGAIDIAFHIPNIEDRARAHSSGTPGQEPRTARTAAGAVLNRLPNPALNGLVIALEYADTPDVLDHERQHVVNNQLLKIRETDGSKPYTLDAMTESVKAGEDAKTAITAYLESMRSSRLRSATDEVIAFFADGTRIDQMKQALTYHKTSYGERFRGINPNIENLIVGRVGEQYRQFVQEAGMRELGIEYDQIIGDCIDAFQILRSKGLSQERTTGLLGTLPPQEWKNFVTNMTAKA